MTGVAALIGCSLSACGTQTVAEHTPATSTQMPARSAAPAIPGPPTTTAAAISPPATTSGTTSGATSSVEAASAEGGGSSDGAGDGGAPAGGSAAGASPGGDEAGNRVPVSFTVAAGSAVPATVTVPPFLGLVLRGTSSDGKSHVIVVEAPGSETLAVPASGTVSRSLAGLPTGNFPVRVDGTAVATLRVAGDAVGP